MFTEGDDVLTEPHRTPQSAASPYVEDLNRFLDEIFHAAQHLEAAEESLRIQLAQPECRAFLGGLLKDIDSVSVMRNALAIYLNRANEQLEINRRRRSA